MASHCLGVFYFLLYVTFVVLDNTPGASAAVMQRTQNLSGNKLHNSSNPTSSYLEYTSNLSVVNGDVWQQFCTDITTWSVSSYNPDHCVWAVEYLYHETMSTGGRTQNEFLAQGVQQKVTRYKGVQTPRKYTFGRPSHSYDADFLSGLYYYNLIARGAKDTWLRYES